MSACQIRRNPRNRSRTQRSAFRPRQGDPTQNDKSTQRFREDVEFDYRTALFTQPRQYLAIFAKPANAGERTALGRFHLRNPLGVLSSFLRALRLSGWAGGAPNYKGDGEIQLPMLKIRLKSHERLDAVVKTKDDILPKWVADDRTFAQPALLYSRFSEDCNRITVASPLGTAG